MAEQIETTDKAAEEKTNLIELLSAVMQIKAEQGTLGSALLKILEKNTEHNHTLDIIRAFILVSAIAAVVVLKIYGHYSAEVGTFIGLVIGHLFTKKSE